MSNLHLRDLVEVSSNCHLTGQVFKTLEEKLTPKEKEDFRLWLRVVDCKIDQEVRKVKHKF